MGASFLKNDRFPKNPKPFGFVFFAIFDACIVRRTNNAFHFVLNLKTDQEI